MYQQRGIAAVVHYQVWAIGPLPAEALLRAPPVLRQRLTLPREDRCGAGLRDTCGRVVLRAEDIAAGPPHRCPQLCKRLDEHARLDRHVQGAGNPEAAKGLLLAVLPPAVHEAGHLTLCQGQLLAAKLRETHVLDLGFAHRNLLVLWLLRCRVGVEPSVLVGLWDRALAQALAHLREEALGLLVLLPLARGGLLEQGPRLLARGVQLDDLLQVSLGVQVVLQPHVRLGLAEEGLEVRGVVLEHVLAGLLRLNVVLQLKLACGAVELAELLQLLRLTLVLLLEIVSVAKHVDHLLVTLHCHGHPALLEHVPAGFLAPRGVLNLLFL
mmetsp:Transcript_35469/g.101983  ORF Transcript_35469/g.101983 Transcript_35469/m.101983 type:complete len:325 (+) Transcript_35469:1088-2062(+)